MFYGKKGKQYLKIFKILTPISLAYWMMCDGYKYNYNVALITNSFSIPDKQILVKAKNSNFEFYFRIISDYDYTTIFIYKNNLIHLQKIVVPHMFSS